MAFIDDMRAKGHAVESTCRVLREQGCQVAARTYRAWRQANRPVASRALSDAVVIDALLATHETPEGLYGRRKMTVQGSHPPRSPRQPTRGGYRSRSTSCGRPPPSLIKLELNV